MNLMIHDMEDVCLFQRNVNGAFERRLYEGHGFFSKKDVMFFQDTYITHADMRSKANFRADKMGMCIYWNDDGMTTHGGVATMIKKPLAESFVVVPTTATPNRYLLLEGRLRVEGEERKVYLHNVYLPTSDKPDDQCAILDALPRAFGPEALHIVAGDFNMPLIPPLDCANGRSSAQPRAVQSLLDWMVSLDVVDSFRLWNPDSNPSVSALTGPRRRNRIDYIFMSSYLHMQYLTSVGHHAYDVDHNACTARLERHKVTMGTGYWRCPVSLFRRDDIRRHVVASAKKFLQRLDDRNPAVQWKVWKRRMRSWLKARHTRLTRHLHERDKVTRDDVEAARASLPTGQTTSEVLEGAIARRNTYLHEAQLDKTEASLVTDMTLSERPTRLFLRRRLTHRDVIRSVTTEEGDTITDVPEVRQRFVECWGQVFGDDRYAETPQHDDDAVSTLLSAVEARVPEAEMDALNQPLTAAELTEAIRNLNRGRAAGLDGLPAEFFQVCPDIFGHILEQVFTFSMSRERLEPDQRRCAVALLHKKGDRSVPSNYRPISLIQTDVKIWSLALNRRLSPVIPMVVHEDQTGFVKGRRITKNLFTLDEAKHAASNDPSSPSAVVLLDMAKAFDRVGWAWMDDCLRHMGFGQYIRRWVKTLYDRPVAHLMINGWVVDGINVGTGVKQGDPSSPSLFALVAEPFLASLRRVREGISHPTRLPPACAFADDTYLLPVDEEESRRQVDVVRLYEAASNAKVNRDKTSIVALHPRRSDDALRIAATWQPEPVLSPRAKVLGLWYSTEPETVALRTATVTNDILATLSSHVGHGRTTKGRTTITNTLLLSKLWYVLPFAPTLRLETGLQALLEKYILTRSSEDVRYQKLMSSAQMTAPVSRGGLGLHDVNAKMKALRLNLLHHLLGHPEAPWTLHVVRTLSDALGGPPEHPSWWFLHVKPKPEVRRALPEVWYHHLTTWWSTLGGPHMTGPDRFTTRTWLNLPIWGSHHEEFKHVKTKRTTNEKTVIYFVRSGLHLHCLGDFYDLTNGEWSTTGVCTKVMALYQAMSWPSRIVLSTVLKVVTAVDTCRRALGVPDRAPRPWRFSDTEWSTVPLALPSVSNREPQPFQDSSSRDRYRVCLGRVDDNSEELARVLGVSAPALQREWRLYTMGNSIPVVYDVLYRVQRRLLPLGYTRKHFVEVGDNGVRCLMPECTVQVETYRHLFLECPKHLLLPTVLTIGARLSRTLIGWEQIVCPSSIKPRWTHLAEPSLLLWKLVVSSAIWCHWRHRNDVTFNQVSWDIAKLREYFTRTVQSHLRVLRGTIIEDADELRRLDDVLRRCRLDSRLGDIFNQDAVTPRQKRRSIRSSNANHTMVVQRL